uniref:Uncharacterized protein n=1 Tax=Cucumis melo TaxID=3656 RepID=A0A9I9DZ05_CUCME
MGNTRKGNYAAKSSEEVHEAPVSKSAMHGVRMRRFQCMSPKAHLSESIGPDDVTISNSNVEPANASTDEPIAIGGRSDVHAVDTPANYEDNGEHVNTGVNDGEIPANESVEPNVNNDPQPENHPILEVSRSTRKKFQ